MQRQLIDGIHELKELITGIRKENKELKNKLDLVCTKVDKQNKTISELTREIEVYKQNLEKQPRRDEEVVVIEQQQQQQQQQQQESHKKQQQIQLQHKQKQEEQQHKLYEQQKQQKQQQQQ